MGHANIRPFSDSTLSRQMQRLRVLGLIKRLTPSHRDNAKRRGRVAKVIAILGRLAITAGFVLPMRTNAEAPPPCDLAGISIKGIASALKVPACRQSEYLADSEDLKDGKVELISIDYSFERSAQLFRGQARDAIDVRQFVRASAAPVLAQASSTVGQMVPAGTCDSYGASDLTFSAPGNGPLLLSVRAHYQKRACTKSTCFVGWGIKYGVPYPKFEACEAKVDIPGASATVRIEGSITPRLEAQKDGKYLLVLDVKYGDPIVEEGIANELLNVVGVFTLGIGSKYIRDEFDRQIGNLRAALVPESVPVGLVNLPRSKKIPVDLRFRDDPPFFDKVGNATRLTLASSTLQDPSVACDVRRLVVQAQKFFASCLNPHVEHRIRAGDSLWDIAESVYGDGQYYRLLAYRNALSPKTANQLRVGQVVKLPPYYDLLLENEMLVQAGDTLWDLSRRKLGDPRRYRQIVDANASAIDHPRKLYSFTPLTMPTIPTKREGRK